MPDDAGAEWSDPWGGGRDCWKIGSKIFALIGAVDARISVKTDGIETAAMLIETGLAQKAPYMHRSWVALPLDTAQDELRHRITRSYTLIRAGLPRKLQATLPPA